MLAQFVKAFQANPSCTGYVGRCPTLQCNSPSGMHLANATGMHLANATGMHLANAIRQLHANV